MVQLSPYSRSNSGAGPKTWERPIKVATTSVGVSQNAGKFAVTEICVVMALSGNGCQIPEMPTKISASIPIEARLLKSSTW
jgi:hypothetical protein